MSLVPVINGCGGGEKNLSYGVFMSMLNKNISSLPLCMLKCGGWL